MMHARPAALAAVLMLLASATGGCETHKAGAEKSSVDDKATPDIDVRKAAEPTTETAAKPNTPPPPPPSEAGDGDGDGPTGTDETAVAAVDPMAGKKSSPQCLKSADHLISLYQVQVDQQIAQVPEEMREQVKAQAAQQLPAIRARILLECSNGWSTAAHKCVQGAKTIMEVATKCRELLEPEAGKAPPPSQPAQPTPPSGDQPPAEPPAAAIGGPSCDKVSANAAAIIAKSNGLDDRQSAMFAGNVLRACQQLGWSAEVKGCIYRASRQAEFDECLRVARIELEP